MKPNLFYEIENIEGVDTERAEEIISELEELINSVILYNEKLYVTKPTIVITRFNIQTGVAFEEAY